VDFKFQGPGVLRRRVICFVAFKQMAVASGRRNRSASPVTHICERQVTIANVAMARDEVVIHEGSNRGLEPEIAALGN